MVQQPALKQHLTRRRHAPLRLRLLPRWGDVLCTLVSLGYLAHLGLALTVELARMRVACHWLACVSLRQTTPSSISISVLLILLICLDLADVLALQAAESALWAAQDAVARQERGAQEVAAGAADALREVSGWCRMGRAPCIAAGFVATAACFRPP